MLLTKSSVWGYSIFWLMQCVILHVYMHKIKSHTYTHDLNKGYRVTNTIFLPLISPAYGLSNLKNTILWYLNLMFQNEFRMVLQLFRRISNPFRRKSSNMRSIPMPDHTQFQNVSVNWIWLTISCTHSTSYQCFITWSLL